MIARRLFIGGLLAGATAPAIVRATSLMPILVIPKALTEAQILEAAMLKCTDAYMRFFIEMQMQILYGTSHPQAIRGAQ